ncbi:MAG: hypothetical protein KDI45_09825 [Candidatus Accumulibacter sp.]|nr:hypothetical protein [Accumulibacter sp.]
MKDERLEALRCNAKVIAKIADEMTKLVSDGRIDDLHKSFDGVPDDDPDKIQWLQWWGAIEGLVTVVEASAALLPDALRGVRHSRAQAKRRAGKPGSSDSPDRDVTDRNARIIAKYQRMRAAGHESIAKTLAAEHGLGERQIRRVVNAQTKPG